MALEKLTWTRATKLIKQGQKGKYGDGGNLWLEVVGVDVAFWLFRWKDRATKKDRSISYGPWHLFDNLEQVRKLARADRQLLWKGDDPKAIRNARKLDEQIAKGIARTVRQVVEEFDKDIISHNALNTQIGTRRRMRIVNRNIGDMPFAKVTVQTILENPHLTPEGKVVQPGLGLAKLWVEKYPTGRHLQSETAQLFAYGIDKGYKPDGYNPALWEHLKRLLPRHDRVHKTKHRPWMPYKDLPRRMQELRSYRPAGQLGSMKDNPLALLIEFMILAGGMRPGEPRLAQWKEFEHLDDTENAVWNIPVEHQKKGREVKHIPVTKEMLAVLNKAKRIFYPKDSSTIGDAHKGRGPIFQRARHVPDTSPDALVFPNSINQPFRPEMIARFIRQTLSWPKVTPHGFRSTFRDWLRKETSFENKEILWKIQAGHRLGDKSDESYGHDKLFEERRDVLIAWAKYCSTPEPKAGKVVRLSDKRRTA